MMLAHVTISAFVVSTAAGIMIPPNVAMEKFPIFRLTVPLHAIEDSEQPVKEDTFNALPHPTLAQLSGFGTSLIDPFTQILQLPCPGCPFASPSKERGFTWSKGVPNTLFLNISVGSNPETLELNGEQLYPPPSLLTMEPESYRIPQVRADVPLTEIRSHPSKYLSHPLSLTNWAFQSTSVHKDVDQDGEEIIKVHLRIKALEQQEVTVPEVVVTAVKSRSAHLLLLKSETEEPNDAAQECDGPALFCKMKGIIASMFSHMGHKMHGGKGCHHRRPGQPSSVMPQHDREHQQPQTQLPKEHGKEKEPQRKPHQHYHSHSQVHRVLRKVTRVMLTIVIPILVGILAGMLTYMVGMVLGTAVVLIWLRFFRGRNSNKKTTNGDYTALAGEEETVDVGSSCEPGNKDIYVDVPPQYDDAVGKDEV